ncbi:MAG: dephospho-CoA kinase [Ruthenibacterium lactatiformans]
MISLAGAQPVLLRPGYITKEQLEDAMGCAVALSDAVLHKLKDGESAASPGMKYKHYAPKADVTILKGSFDAYKEYMKSHCADGVYALCFTGEEPALPCPCVTYGRADRPDEQAHALFSALRELDARGAKTVFARCPAQEGVAMAVYNRLLRAAAFRVVEVGCEGDCRYRALRLRKKHGFGHYGSLGYPVLDADRTAREVTRPGGPCLAQLCDAFGSDILLPDGTLDRGCLAARAFATPEGTRRLTDITHPAIIRELLDSVAAAQSTGVPFVFVDGAVIVGEAFEQYCDAIIVVTASEREAVSRIVLRDGISKQAARMRLAAQTPEDVLRAAADYIIANTGDGRHLRAAAQAVLERLLAKETNGTKEKT